MATRGRGQQAEEKPAVSAVAEDEGSVDAANRDVVHPVRQEAAEQAGHGMTLARCARNPVD